MLTEAYGVKQKKLLKYKCPSVPLKKSDNSFAFSDIDKANVFKAHLHETFQPHHDILTPEHMDEVNTYLNYHRQSVGLKNISPQMKLNRPSKNIH